MDQDAGKLSKDDLYCDPEPPQSDAPTSSEQAINLLVQDQDYTREIKELQAYLDKVNEIAKPGCSPQLLNVALSSMSSLVDLLSHISSIPKLHASL